MPTKMETILEALKTLLEGTGADVFRNSVIPEDIPTAGLIIIRDGEPGEPYQSNGSAVCFYEHDVEVEIYVQKGDPDARETAYDTLVDAIGTALQSDQTLGGNISGMRYGRPASDGESVDGAEDIKFAILGLRLDYTTSSPIG